MDVLKIMYTKMILMSRIKKVLKVILLTFAVLFGLLLLIPLLFKSEIIQKFKEEINQNLNAKVDFGDFSLSMFRSFPDLNFTVSDMSVAGLDTFSKDTLFYADKIRTRIDLWSLTKDEFIIESVSLVHPKIKAKVLKDGRANWNVFKESDDTPEDEESSFTFLLKKFQIQNGKVVYDDLESDIFTTIDDMDIELKTISKPEQKYETSTSFGSWTFKMEGMEYLKDAKAKLLADIQTDAANWKLTFLKNTLWLNEMSFVLNGFLAMPDDIEMDMGFNSEKSDFKGLLSLIPVLYKSDFEKLNAKGNVVLNGKVSGIYSDTSFPFIGVGLKVDHGEIAYKGMPDKINKIDLDFEVDHVGAGNDKMTVNLKNFSGSFAGNPVNMKLLVTNIDSDPSLDGMLKGKLDLSLLTRIFPLEGKKISGVIDADVMMKGRLSAIERKDFEHFDAKGFVKGSGIRYQELNSKIKLSIPSFSLSVTPAYLDIRNFNLLPGKSDFALTGKVFNYLSYYFRDEPIRGAFILNSKMLDVNEIMSFTSTDTSTETVSNKDSFSLDLPVNVDMSFTANVDQLIYDDIRIQKAQGTVRLSDGKVFLDKFRVNMLKGVVDISGTYATKDLMKPEVQIKMNMNQIDIGETFRTFNTVRQLAPIAEKRKGLFNLNLDFKGRMNELITPDLSTLTGTCQFRTNHIEIEKSEVFQMISSAIKSEKFKNLALKDIKADIIMIDGKFKILPFVVKNKQNDLLISGDQGIDGSIDYLLNFDVASEELGKDALALANQVLTNSAGKYGVDLKLPERIRFDALVKGTLKKPVIKIDAKKQLSQVKEKIVEQAKEKIQETYTKARDEAVDLAQKKADELMANARIAADKIIAEASKSAQQIKDLGEKSAQKVIEEADKRATELVAKAGSNPIAKIAAEEGAKKIRKEAQNGAAKVRKEADSKADQGMQLAHKQADDLLAKARKEGDDLIAKAKNTSLQM